MNRILEAAKNKDQIKKFGYVVHCPFCGNKQYSPFDKLFTFSYGKCLDCTAVEELDDLSKNIFAIL